MLNILMYLTLLFSFFFEYLTNFIPKKRIPVKIKKIRKLGSPRLPPDNKIYSSKNLYLTQWYHITKTQRACITIKKNSSNKKAIIWLNGLVSYFKDLALGERIISKADLFIVDLPTLGFASNFGKADIVLDKVAHCYSMIDKLFVDYQITNYQEIIIYGRNFGAIIGANYCQQSKYKIHKLIMYDPLFDLKSSWTQYFSYFFLKWFPELTTDIYCDNSIISCRWGVINTIINLQRNIWKNKINLKIPVLIILKNKNQRKYTNKLSTFINVQNTPDIITFL